MVVKKGKQYKEDMDWNKKRSQESTTLYKEVFTNWTRVPDDTSLKMKDHVCLLANRDDGETIYVYEKFPRHSYTEIYIEVLSDTSKLTPGWFFKKCPKKTQGVLHWGFPDYSIMLKWKEFQTWVSQANKTTKFRKHINPTDNRSQGYLIPIRDIPMACFYVEEGQASKQSFYQWKDEERISTN